MPKTDLKVPFALVELPRGFETTVKRANAWTGGRQEQKAVGVKVRMLTHEVVEKPNLLCMQIVQLCDLSVQPGIGVFA